MLELFVCLLFRYRSDGTKKEPIKISSMVRGCAQYQLTYLT